MKNTDRTSYNIAASIWFVGMVAMILFFAKTQHWLFGAISIIDVGIFLYMIWGRK